jgi:ribosomal protein RSM22 (predicted rRNA methylase)
MIISLPPPLVETIEMILKDFDRNDLKIAAQDIIQSYARGASTPDTPLFHAAYLATRLPATYAVISQVFKLLDTEYTSLLDLGAGPGTATLAASARFPSLEKATLVEQHLPLLDLGKKLLSDTLIQATCKVSSVTDVSIEKAELAVLSYALIEMNRETQIQAIENAWAHTQNTFVIIEPGTPKGYENIIHARHQLMEAGAKILAPCPHHQQCPMLKQEGDWCHFSQRLNRFSGHLLIKDAVLPYEDEKYCYLIVNRSGMPLVKNRIVKKPITSKGLVILDLCQEDGNLQRHQIPKSFKQAYKQARKASWGDGWDYVS